MTGIDAELRRLPPGLRPEVGQYWEAFAAAARATNLELPTDGLLPRQLVPVWAGSEFIARACIREPALLAEL